MFALEIANFQAIFLSNSTSYVDTTQIESFLDQRVDVALADDGCCFGPLLSSLQDELKNLVSQHKALTDEQRRAVIED